MSDCTIEPEPTYPYATCDGCCAVARLSRWITWADDDTTRQSLLPAGWRAGSYDVFVSRDFGLDTETAVHCPDCVQRLGIEETTP